MSENGESTAVIVRPMSLPSVADMRNKLQERAATRELLTTHMKETMVEGQHFGTIPNTNKPMLYQDGARLVQSIFDVFEGKPELEEQYFEDDHYRCLVHLPLISQATGDIVRYGSASCSTRESKYASRWVYENEVPVGVDKVTLKSITKIGKNKKPYTKYLLPNADLADLHHTVLTMAIKRAGTRAVLKLPAVAEIFNEPEVEEDTQDEARDFVLGNLRGWFRTRTDLNTATRDIIVSLVFRVINLKALSTLATDMLQEGLGTLETADINWASPTLREDYKAWLAAQAQGNIAELFGGSPGDMEPEQEMEVSPVSTTGTKQSAKQKEYELAADITLQELAKKYEIGEAELTAQVDQLLPEDFDRAHMTIGTLDTYKVTVVKAIEDIRKEAAALSAVLEGA